jgi:ATP-dependent Clp protease ATP-binding subunit ClpC
MIGLGSWTDYFSETGKKVARRAIALSKSCDHNFIGVTHLFMALVEVESALFLETMQAVGVDPDSVRRLLEEELANCPQYQGRKMAIPEPTRNLLNRALRRARAQGQHQIESYDLFATLFNYQNSEPAEILRRLGADPALVIIASETISQGARRREKQAESLRNRLKSRDAQPFNFSRLTADFLDSIATIEERARRQNYGRRRTLIWPYKNGSGSKPSSLLFSTSRSSG